MTLRDKRTHQRGFAYVAVVCGAVGEVSFPYDGCMRGRIPTVLLALFSALLVIAWMVSIWREDTFTYTRGEYGPGPVVAQAFGCVLVGIGDGDGVRGPGLRHERWADKSAGPDI